MKIGIDGRNLKTDRAIFRYTRNLLNSLALIDKDNEYLLFMEGDQHLNALKYLNLSSNWKLVKAPKKIVLRDHFLFKNYLDGYQLDIFFHPDNTEFLNCHRNSVVTVHDLLPYVLPELVLSRSFVPRLRQSLYFQLQRLALGRISNHIITVSKNSKADIMRIFGVNQEEVTVIYEGVESGYSRRTPDEINRVKNHYGISGDYVFSHVGFSAYKNVLGLIRAFALFLTSFPQTTLVIGGRTPNGAPYFREIVAEVKKLGLGNKVVFTDYIAEDMLPALYSGASIFAYPSLYEGFGIPILEAQACGVPVVCSNTSSLPEVAGRGAVFFNPYDETDIRRALVEVYSDAKLKEELVKLGEVNAANFSWERCARETLSVFNKVYDSPKK